MGKPLLPFLLVALAAGAYPNIGWDASDIGTSIDPYSAPADIRTFSDESESKVEGLSEQGTIRDYHDDAHY